MSVKEETSLDPRVQRTLEMLQQATMELLTEKGLRRLTVQDITARAGINRATFYAHFDDKYALLDFMVRNRFEDALTARIPSPTEYTAENLRLLILAVCDFLGPFSEQCKKGAHIVQAEPMIEVRIQTCIYDVLYEWITALLPADADVSPGVAATTASWAIFGSVLRWSRENRKLSAEQLVDQVLPLVMTGLAGVTRQSAVA